MRYTRRFWKRRSRDGKLTVSHSRTWIGNAPRWYLFPNEELESKGTKPLR